MSDTIINDTRYNQDIDNYINSLIIYNSLIILKFIENDSQSNFLNIKDRLTDKHKFVIEIKNKITQYLNQKNNNLDKITEITGFLKKNKSEFIKIINDILR
jgi:hypothetical protein